MNYFSYLYFDIFIIIFILDNSIFDNHLIISHYLHIKSDKQKNNKDNLVKDIYHLR